MSGPFSGTDDSPIETAKVVVIAIGLGSLMVVSDAFYSAKRKIAGIFKKKPKEDCGHGR